MSDLSTIYERNERYANSFADADLGIRPNLMTVILTCIDCRVDPAHFAGIDPGDAFVMRTAGGRVTEGVMVEVALLWQLMKLSAGGTDPTLGLAIVHHTDCGMARFAVPQIADAITAAFGADVLETYAIADERSSVADDVGRALGSKHTPTGLTVSGHIYSVSTGRLEQIVAPEVAG